MKLKSSSLRPPTKFTVYLEVTLILTTNFLVSYFRFGRDWSAVFFEYPGQPKIFIYPIIWFFGMYSAHAWERSYILKGISLYTCVVDAAWRSLLIFTCFVFFINFPISRIWLALNIIATASILLIFRLTIRNFFLRKVNYESDMNFLYIGTSDSKTRDIIEFEANYSFIPSIEIMHPNYMDDPGAWLEKYKNKLCSSHFYGVIVGFEQIPDSTILKLIADIERDKITDFLVTSKISPLISRIEIDENPSFMRVREVSLVSSGALIKRLFDIIFSASMMLILSPLYILIWLLIKISSPGPILYVDKRVGQNGKLFKFPKFRSMYEGSDKERLQILGRPDEGMTERYKDDPRITPIGRVIRRWSLDELPQFYCVLIGTMSVVGPRPVLQQELVQIKQKEQIRFIAKPGLTGLWQVTGRKEVLWEDRMLRDISYVENWSPSRDIVLILRTIKVIFTGYGAH